MKMDNRIAMWFIVMSLLLISVVKSDISAADCEDYEDEIETTNPPKKLKKDFKGRPRPDQKSLLLVFDNTDSMSSDLAQLQEAARAIVNTLAGLEEKPIYNYILSVFNDSGWLQSFIEICVCETQFLFLQFLRGCNTFNYA